MYLTEYGRFVLEAYNRRHTTQHTARTFFDEVLWPVAFDAPDGKHFFNVSNSSFFQGVKKDTVDVVAYKLNRFNNTIKEVVQGRKPISGSVAVGYMAEETDATTSGMVSDLKWKWTEDSILHSWIGAAVAVNFGFNLLILSEEIALFIIEGWKYYRELLVTDDFRKGNNIEAWNGIWLYYGASHRCKPSFAYEIIKNNIGNHNVGSPPEIALKFPDAIKNPNWVSQIFQMASDFPNLEDIGLYAYQFGKQNKTLGFSTLYLGAPRRLENYWQRLLGPEYPKNKDIQTVYKTQLGFQTALLSGGIGLRAMQPKDIRKFVGSPELPKTDENNRDAFNIYITWTRAMLNNEDFDVLAERLAKELVAFADQDTRGKTTLANKVNSVWAAANKQGFVSQLTELLESTANTETLAPVLKETVKAIQLKIPADQFRWFHTLGKFYYRLNQSSNPETQND